jgi:hypothetical protein
MGRLIDADAFAVTLKQISEKQGYAELYMNVDDVLNSVIEDLQGNALNGYENCPTVEAIPKADYENRLKADLKAILVELQLEIEEKFNDRPFSYNHHQRTEFYRDIDEVIQQKINSLKEA